MILAKIKMFYSLKIWSKCFQGLEDVSWGFEGDSGNLGGVGQGSLWSCCPTCDPTFSAPTLWQHTPEWCARATEKPVKGHTGPACGLCSIHQRLLSVREPASPQLYWLWVLKVRVTGAKPAGPHRNPPQGATIHLPASSLSGPQLLHGSGDVRMLEIPSPFSRSSATHVGEEERMSGAWSWLHGCVSWSNLARLGPSAPLWSSGSLSAATGLLPTVPDTSCSLGPQTGSWPAPSLLLVLG